MYSLLFFIVASLIVSLNNAMISGYKIFKENQYNPYNLGNMPEDMLKTIITINIPSAKSFEAYVIRQSIFPLNAHENRYNICFDKEFIEKSDDASDFLHDFWSLLLVSHNTYNALSQCKMLITERLSNENIFFSGYEFNQACQYIVNDDSYDRQDLAYPNPLIHLMNITKLIDLKKASKKMCVGSYTIIPEMIPNCTFTFNGYIRGDHHMYRAGGYTCSVVVADIVIMIPLSALNMHLREYVNPNNQLSPITQSMYSIFNDFNNAGNHQGITQFQHVENLFETICSEFFNHDEQQDTKKNCFFGFM